MPCTCSKSWSSSSTALIGAAAAYALDEHHILRVLAVGKALQMTLCGACRVHDTLELEGRDDILALAVCVLVVLIELDGIEAGSDDDSAVLLGNDFILLLVIDGARLTNLLAQTALSGFELDASFAVDDRDVRDCLCERGINSASRVQAAVEFARGLSGRTFLLQTPQPVHLDISTLRAFLRMSTVKSPTKPETFSTSLYVYR